jgi:DNA-binding Lrp family transcriptional regulator
MNTISHRIAGLAHIRPITALDVAAHFGISTPLAARRIYELTKTGILREVGALLYKPSRCGPHFKLYGIRSNQ